MDSPPPGYSAPVESLQTERPQVPHHEDFVQEQIGGGRRFEDTPVEHTPTKLRSHIKATNRDAGLVKEASARRARLLNEELGQPVAQSRELSAPPPHLVHRERSVPPQPPLRQRSIPPQPALREHSAPLQLPIQDVFYEAPLIGSSDGAPADAREPPQPNLFTKPSFHPLDEFDFSSMDLGSCGDVGEGLAGPSTLLPAVPTLPTLPAVPQTYITPPTPAGPAGWDTGRPYTDDFTMDDVFDLAMDNAADVVPAVKGRRLQMSDAILREGFLDLERMIQDLSHKTAIPAHQVFALWNKSRARSSNTVNHWNAYSSYFKDNLKNELARLGGKAPEIHGTPSEFLLLLVDVL